jgi:hypothetical protein
MTKVPSLGYEKLIRALLKRSTLSHILKQARLPLEDFLKLAQ